MTNWTAQEYNDIKELAEEYGIPVAGLIHDIVTGALKSLRNPEKR